MQKNKTINFKIYYNYWLFFFAGIICFSTEIRAQCDKNPQVLKAKALMEKSEDKQGPSICLTYELYICECAKSTYTSGGETKYRTKADAERLEDVINATVDNYNQIAWTGPKICGELEKVRRGKCAFSEGKKNGENGASGSNEQTNIEKLTNRLNAANQWAETKASLDAQIKKYSTLSAVTKPSDLKALKQEFVTNQAEMLKIQYELVGSQFKNASNFASNFANDQNASSSESKKVGNAVGLTVAGLSLIQSISQQQELKDAYQQKCENMRKDLIDNYTVKRNEYFIEWCKTIDNKGADFLMSVIKEYNRCIKVFYNDFSYDNLKWSETTATVPDPEQIKNETTDDYAQQIKLLEQKDLFLQKISGPHEEPSVVIDGKRYELNSNRFPKTYATFNPEKLNDAKEKQLKKLKQSQDEYRYMFDLLITNNPYYSKYRSFNKDLYPKWYADTIKASMEYISNKIISEPSYNKALGYYYLSHASTSPLSKLLYLVKAKNLFESEKRTNGIDFNYPEANTIQNEISIAINDYHKYVLKLIDMELNSKILELEKQNFLNLAESTSFYLNYAIDQDKRSAFFEIMNYELKVKKTKPEIDYNKIVDKSMRVGNNEYYNFFLKNKLVEKRIESVNELSRNSNNLKSPDFIKKHPEIVNDTIYNGDRWQPILSYYSTSFESVKLLLENGADPNKLNYKGDNILFKMIDDNKYYHYDHGKIPKEDSLIIDLLAHNQKFDPMAENSSGKTILEVALEIEHPRFMKYIINQFNTKLNFNHYDQYGNGLLGHALSYSNKQVLESFLEIANDKIEFNAPNKNGITEFQNLLLSEDSKWEKLDLLLKASKGKIDVNKKINGYLPVKYTMDSRHLKLKQTLILAHYGLNEKSKSYLKSFIKDLRKAEGYNSIKDKVEPDLIKIEELINKK